MRVSQDGRALIAAFEGLRLDAYLCPAGVWTIGYGHTAGVQPGQSITAAEADALLAGDLLSYGQHVETLAGMCSRHELDAMTSLAFNIGKQGFATSSVLRRHKAGDRAGAARAFGLWNKATVNGELIELPGLTRRRAAEAVCYLTPDVQTAEPMPQAVAAPASPGASKTVLVTAGSGLGAASIIAENARPAIDAIRNTAETVSQAKDAWAGVKDALGAFANGHVFTVAVLAVVVGLLIYVGVRYWRKARAGDVVVR